MAFFWPRWLAMFIAQAFSHDHSTRVMATLSEAGGFGFLGTVRGAPDLTRAGSPASAATTRHFKVNLIPAIAEPDLLEVDFDVVNRGARGRDLACHATAE
jgi:hypothetical protein